MTTPASLMDKINASFAQQEAAGEVDLDDFDFDFDDDFADEYEDEWETLNHEVKPDIPLPEEKG